MSSTVKTKTVLYHIRDEMHGFQLLLAASNVQMPGTIHIVGKVTDTPS